jgi:hypothetical protein
MLGLPIATQIAQKEQGNEDHGDSQQNIRFDEVEHVHDNRHDSRNNPGNGVPIIFQELFHISPKLKQPVDLKLLEANRAYP